MYRFLAIGILISLTASACTQSEGETVDVKRNTSIERSMSHEEVIAFLFSDDEFKECAHKRPQTLESSIASGREVYARYALDFERYSGDALAEKTIEFASEIHDDITAYRQEQVTMFLFDRASQQGSVIADAEIGAALLFCYQHISQDLKGAQKYLELASDQGDGYASLGLSRMYANRYIPSVDTREKIKTLLTQCVLNTTDQELIEECDDYLAKFK